jgi:hypothetical protein
MRRIRSIGCLAVLAVATMLARADCIGLPSVVKVGHRLAVFYDAPGGTSVSHMNRDVGLAWLNLPLIPPRVIE